MPYDERLDQRIRTIVNRWQHIAHKKMFGGICYLQQGNMFSGVHRKHLILRLGPEQAETALTNPHVMPFDVTGRPMKGWVMVSPDGVRTDPQLRDWLKKARAFAATLPPKN